MFQPLHSLFTRPTPVWEETDLKYFVQEYVQSKLATRRVTCVEVTSGQAVMEVGSPALQQAVQLLEFEICRDLQTATNYSLTRLVIRVV